MLTIIFICIIVLFADGFWRGTKLVDLKIIADNAIQICADKLVNISATYHFSCTGDLGLELRVVWDNTSYLADILFNLHPLITLY